MKALAEDTLWRYLTVTLNCQISDLLVSYVLTQHTNVIGFLLVYVFLYICMCFSAIALFANFDMLRNSGFGDDIINEMFLLLSVTHSNCLTYITCFE